MPTESQKVKLLRKRNRKKFPRDTKDYSVGNTHTDVLYYTTGGKTV